MSYHESQARENIYEYHLDWAALFGRLKMVEYLVLVCGTPIHWTHIVLAIIGGHRDLTNYLLSISRLEPFVEDVYFGIFALGIIRQILLLVGYFD